MSDSKRDKLLAQLSNETDSQQRKDACKKLAATRDPSVIPALRETYNHDSDDAVKAAAREALTRFKMMQIRTERGGAFRVLRSVLIALVLLFVVSLGLNGAALLSEDNDADSPEARPRIVTDRTELIIQVGSKLNEAQVLTSNLRNEITKYDNTGQVDCAMSYDSPALLDLSDDDEYTYPDIRSIGETFNAAQPKFEIVMKLFNNACIDPDAQTASVIKAAQTLDEIEAHLTETNRLLQRAINNPVPTVGPTETPQPPTETFTPPAATTQPAQATGTPGVAVTGSAESDATSAPATPLPPTATATFTPVPSPTLPLPGLDYAAIVAEFRERLQRDFLWDLQNPFGTGMLDQWQQSISTQGQTTTNYCQLTPAWPEPFTLSDEQQAQLNAPGVADDLLQEALQLQQDAFALARQARALYERDCAQSNLSDSAGTGITLLTEAVDKLDRVQNLLNDIAAR